MILNDGAVYTVKAASASSASVNAFADSRYSIFTASPLLSVAVIVTVCVSLKNRPKVIVLRSVFHSFVSRLILPVGFSMSFHRALTVISFAGIFLGTVVSQPMKV